MSLLLILILLLLFRHRRSYYGPYWYATPYSWHYRHFHGYGPYQMYPYALGYHPRYGYYWHPYVG